MDILYKMRQFKDMTSEKGIWIITDDTTAVDTRDGSKAGRNTGYDYGDEPEIKPDKRLRRISAQELKANMDEFLEVVQTIFEKAEQSQSSLQLEEIELSVEINGKGQVGLLGTGGELGGKGAIQLKFKRKIEKSSS